MPWGWCSFAGGHFRDEPPRAFSVGRPKRDRRAVKNARRARRLNRR